MKTYIQGLDVGVMQGRLLPKFKQRFQAHPVGYWQSEFAKVSALGLNCIEFILDYEGALENPLLNASGIEEILRLSEETGVAVKTICADYYMDSPLHSESEAEVKQGLEVMKTLVEHGKLLGMTDIVLPCVDQSSLKTVQQVNRFVKVICDNLYLFEDAGINLSLETDLAPKAFLSLLSEIASPSIRVNYDTGNSAALGYDPVEELETYGHLITDVHIKDRTLHGGSVILGNGEAHFDAFFQTLKQQKYQGPFIFQAYRDDEGLEVFKQQLDYIKPWLQDFANG